MKDTELLYKTAFEVVWYMIEHEGYGKKESNAIGAFKKLCPGFDTNEYSKALKLCKKLLGDSKKIVRNNIDVIWTQWDEEKMELPYSKLDTQLQEAHPGIPVSTIRLAIHMVFYSYHLY